MKILGVKIDSRKGDSTDFVTFDLSDVNYIKMDRLKKNSELVPVYHTIDGTYAPILTLKDLSIALISKGFEYADKSTIINKNRVVNYSKDGTGINIKFIDDSSINVSRRSKYL